MNGFIGVGHFVYTPIPNFHSVRPSVRPSGFNRLLLRQKAEFTVNKDIYVTSLLCGTHSHWFEVLILRILEVRFLRIQ